MSKVYLTVGGLDGDNPPKQEATPKPKKVLLKVKKRDMGALDKDLDANINNYRKEAVDFFNTYIDSPNYKARLLKQGYSDKEANDAIALRKANLRVTGIEKYWGRPSGSQYSKEDQKVYVDPSQFAMLHNLTIPGLLGHEYSHVAGAMDPLTEKMPAPMRLSEKESKEIESRNKLSKIDIDNLPEDQIESIAHDRIGQEGKADLDALRYMMYRDKFFDTGTQEFNKELLKKAKERYSRDITSYRLFKNFSDEDIIWMMNNIAKNEPQKKVMLRVGKNDILT